MDITPQNTHEGQPVPRASTERRTRLAKRSGLVTAAAALVVAGTAMNSAATSPTAFTEPAAVVGAATTSTMAQATSLDELVAASDYLTEYGEVLRFYPAFFGREADVAGAQYWIGDYQAGRSTNDIARDFANNAQDEFVAAYADIEASDYSSYLTRVYTNMLGRTPDADGFNYWLAKMESGELDRGSVVRWVAANDEFISIYPYESTATGVDVDLFFDGALESATTVDCTLSDGTDTTCYSLTIAGYPTSHEVGPFCPSTTSDTAEAGGIWFDGDAVYDLSGQFFVDLETTYNDSTWHMYDAEGNILVTETADEFEAAARPDVDPDLENHCVEGALEWLENGEPVTQTVLIPVVPVLADTPGTTSGNLGVTLDGVVIAPSAPVDAILSAYTIAAFDDCGGHFNPTEGYHLHGAVGCSELGTAVDGETPMFGYAMDGYPVHSPLAEEDIDAAELDSCNGHTTDADGYHYHANSAEENLVIECMIGVTVEGADEAPGGPPGGGPQG